MSILKNIYLWWKTTDPAPDHEDYASSESVTENKNKIKENRILLNSFIQSTFYFLGSEEAKSIASRVSRKARTEEGYSADFVSAICDGLLGDYYKNGRKPYCINFDARYVEDVDLRINKVLKSYGVSSLFKYDSLTHDVIPIEVLKSVAIFSKVHGFESVLIDDESDSYIMFFCSNK